MAVSTFSVRMESNLKDNFIEICNDLGLSMSSAINIFAKSVVNDRKIPFVIEQKNSNSRFLETLAKLQDEATNSNFNDMSLNDINNLIRSTRKSK